MKWPKYFWGTGTSPSGNLMEQTHVERRRREIIIDFDYTRQQHVFLLLLGLFLRGVRLTIAVQTVCDRLGVFSELLSAFTIKSL